MTDRTENLGLVKTPTGNESILDRVLADLLTHRHSGDPALFTDPAEMPGVELLPGGQLEATKTFHYAFTIADAAGQESGPSPWAQVTTDGLDVVPEAPTLELVDVGQAVGLKGGNYFYVLSAYVGDASRETLPGVAAHLFVAFHARQGVRLRLPALPSGATGFCIYRRNPGSPFFYLAGTSSDGAWVDDGSAMQVETHPAPVKNTTNIGRTVRVHVPALPAGATGWRLYRSVDGASPPITELVASVEALTTSFDDVGGSEERAAPPAISEIRPRPAKIDLVGEVDGVLPIDQAAYPMVACLRLDIPRAVWVCEAPTAQVIGARLVASVAFDTDQTVAVEVGDTSVALVLLAGSLVGERQTVEASVAEGDCIRAMTTTPGDITVSVYLVAHGVDAVLPGV